MTMMADEASICFATLAEALRACHRGIRNCRRHFIGPIAELGFEERMAASCCGSGSRYGARREAAVCAGQDFEAPCCAVRELAGGCRPVRRQELIACKSAGLPAAGVQWSPGIHSAFLNQLAIHFLWQDSLAVLDAAEQAPCTEPWDAAVRVYNIVITTCGRASQWQVSLQLMSQLVESCCARPKSLLQRFPFSRRTLVTYGVAAAACAVSQSWDGALCAVDGMRGVSLSPSKEVFNLVIDTCRRSWAWQQALHNFRRSEALGLVSPLQLASLRRAAESGQAPLPVRFNASLRVAGFSTGIPLRHRLA
mmetsp:Transcript_46659/g.87217  ORF Transcript_46659/g.87217 Transcript_46659/m.87217 type:complete len:308 (-) Transcript_46659:137-1060(-)